jgi:hypothetical protein
MHREVAVEEHQHLLHHPFKILRRTGQEHEGGNRDQRQCRSVGVSGKLPCGWQVVQGEKKLANCVREE